MRSSCAKHFSSMRGSPLLRTLIVLAALLVTGLALSRLTAARPSPQATAPKQETTSTPEPATAKTTFELILSGTAKEITLDAGAAAVKKTDTAGPVSGTLELSGESPVVSLRVSWKDEAPGHRFVMLRLEVPGKDTLEHVFTAPGEIDDIWEPLP